MTLRQRKAGGVWAGLPALAFPVLCGLALIAHHQAYGSGRAFSDWLAETYGLRHAPLLARTFDRWAASLAGQGAADPVPPAPAARLGRPDAATVLAHEEPPYDPDREIRRLLADRPEPASFAEAKLLLARELAGRRAGPDAPGDEARPEPASMLALIPDGTEQDGLSDRTPPAITPAPHKRVFVHYSTLDPRGAEIADGIARHLRRQGYVVADIRPVAYPVRTSSIRYFFADDAPAASGLRAVFAAGLDASGMGSSDPRVRDFQHFRPNPNRGTIELWIPISGG